MAKEIADSTLLDTWASSGLIVEPDISKIIEGWQLGEQPPHEYMNWLQNTFGSKLNHILKNGVAKWNNETEYLAGSTTQHNGSVWICKTTNTNSEPTDSNNNWGKIPSLENLPLTVDTINDFPTNATTGDTCIVKDLDRGGIFVYDSTKVSEDNQGTNFNGWVRQYSGAVNVKWFGAKGDGVTDDTVAIQSAVNNIPNTAITNSNKLYIPSGSYKITKPILIHLKDGMQIVGDGKFATKIYSSGVMYPDLTVVSGFPADRVFKDIVYSDKPCFFMVSAMRVTGGVDDGYNVNGANAAAWHLAFKDFSLHAEDSSRYTVDGIYAPQIAESVIDNIYMKNVKDGIASCQMYKLNITNYKVSFAKSPFNHFSTYTTEGVISERSNGTTVHLGECGADNCQFGWTFDRLIYSSFDNVAIDNWGRGVECSAITTPDITPYAYAFTGTCNVTLNGCGAEGASTLPNFAQARGLIYSNGNNIIFNGGNFKLGLVDSGLTNTSIIQQSNVSFNNSYINQSGKTIDVKVSSNIFITTMDTTTPFPTHTGESVYSLFKTDSTSYISFLNPSERPRVYANKPESQSLALNGHNIVTFNELIDSSNSFNSDTFTAPYGGMYSVSGCITKTGAGVNYGYLVINGEQSPIIQLDEAATTQETIPFSWAGLLQSGDTVVITVRTSASGSPSILDGGYISIVAL